VSLSPHPLKGRCTLTFGQNICRAHPTTVQPLAQTANSPAVDRLRSVQSLPVHIHVHVTSAPSSNQTEFRIFRDIPPII